MNGSILSGEFLIENYLLKISYFNNEVDYKFELAILLLLGLITRIKVCYE